MSVKATYSTPMLHVAEIERSNRFYELLGFAAVDPIVVRPWDGRDCIARAAR